MLLANTSDKNVTQIVDKVQNGNVMRYARAVGLDNDNIVIYGKKMGAEIKGLPIFLSNRLGNASNLWAYNLHGVVLMQRINDRAKELGINKEIYTTEDDGFAEEKGFTYTIGLPLYLRVNHPEFCSMIIELFIGSFFGVIENLKDGNKELKELYNNTDFAKHGTFRVDLPKEAKMTWRDDEEDDLEETPDDDEDNEEDGEVRF